MNITTIFVIASSSILLIWIIFILLVGEITLRKLRKLPEIKEDPQLLGLQFSSGGDIFNVAITLSLPNKMIKRYNQAKIYFVFANIDLLYAHTRPFERVLARILFWISVLLLSDILLVWPIFKHYIK